MLLLGAGIHQGAQAQTEPTAAENVAAAEAHAEASAAQTSSVVIALIQMLIKEGVISVEKAQEMLDQAEHDAAIARQRATAPPPSTVRVPYVPETVKNQIREELRSEITEQAKTERWGVPGTLPGWIDRIEIGGDIRLRAHGDYFGNNFPFFPDAQAINEEGGVDNADGFPFINSTDDRKRLRYRTRLHLKAGVSPGIKVGISLASGEDSGPVSTNKTFGDYQSKDPVWLDRAYIEATPVKGLVFTGGRMPNPFFSTDLVWDSDINFEGLAFNGKYDIGEGSSANSLFATAGVFPLLESSRNSDRWLYAGQIGGTVAAGSGSLKLGAAWYEYDNVQSSKNPADGSRLNDYTKPPLLAQGNSIFNMRTDGLTTLAGLASDFRLLNITGQAEFPINPTMVVRISADYVQNMAMDAAEIDDLRGEPGVKPGDTGWQARMFVGHKKIAARSSWDFSAAYRRLETDAVLDVFADSDFGAYGGTDLEGYVIEGNYAVAENTWFSLKWLSADSIERAPFSTDVVLFDLNARF
jgi:hypothetical protein